jgi:transcriptional regulator with XRE-family HTH domain
MSEADGERPSDEDLKRRVGFVIQRARMAKGLSAPALADLLHTSAKTINRWEKGEAAPSLIDLGPLCHHLGLDPLAFIDLPPDPVSRYLRLADAAVLGAEEALGEGQQQDPSADEPPERGRDRRSA